MGRLLPILLLVNLTATLAFAELAGESLQVGMPNPDRFGPQRVVLADAIPSQPGSLLQNPWLVAILVGGVGALKLLVEGGTKKKRSRREKKAPRSAATVARPTTKTPAAEKQPGTFADLSWDEFEMLVGEIYRREGYSVQMLAAAGADGGIDLTLKREGETVLVQCKNWNSGGKVTAKEIREFYGVLISERANRGIFVTAGEYTRDGLEFAAGKPIEIVDGLRLAELMRTAQSDLNDNLLSVGIWGPVFAQSVERIEPMCPSCRGPMTMRTPRSGGVNFWGCPTYPKCRGRREVRKYFEAAS